MSKRPSAINKSAKMAEKWGKVHKYLHISEKSCTFVPEIVLQVTDDMPVAKQTITI